MLILLLIGSCGGGGGSGSTGNTGGTATPPPPPSVFSFDADKGTAFVDQIGTVVNGIVEHAITATRDSHTLIGQGASHVFTCRNAGVVEMTLLDADGDGNLSSGDSATFVYNGCEIHRSASKLTGTTSVEFAEVGIESGVRIRARISTAGPLFDWAPPGGSQLEGEINVFAYLAHTVEVLEIETSPGGTLRYEYGLVGWPSETTDTISRLTVTRIKRLDATERSRYRVTWNMDINSTILSGSVNCQTTEVLDAPWQGEPDAGQFICSARDGTAIRVSANPNDDSRMIFEVDDNADGMFAVEQLPEPIGGSHWDKFRFVFDRTIGGSPGGYIGPVPIPEIASTHYVLNAYISAYDPASNRLYVPTVDQLLVLDGNSATEEAAVDLPYRPRSIAISDDGSTIWLGYFDEPVLQSIRTADYSLGPEISLSSPPPIVDPIPVEAAYIGVAPGMTDRVVLNTNLRGLLAVENGVVLPDTVAMTSNTIPNFLDNDTLVMGLSEPPGFDDLSVVHLNPTTGLSVSRSYPDYLRLESKQMTSDGILVYSGSGRIFDVEQGSIKGRVPLAFDQPTGNFQFSSDLSDMYGMFHKGVSAYARSPLELRAAYQPATPSGGVSGALHLSDESLFIANNQGISRISLADLRDNYAEEPCDLFDLSGLSIEGFLLKLRCRVTGLAYDSLRDTLLVATSGNGGDLAGLILFVDPQTGDIAASVNLGALPGEIEISNDSSLLYVSMAESTEIAVIDLATRSLQVPVHLGLRTDSSGLPFAPFLASRISVSSVIPGFFVAAGTHGDLAVYQDRMRAPQLDIADGTVGNVLLSADESRALVLTSEESAVFDVSAAGISRLTVLGAILPNSQATRRGDTVFLADGQVFDFSDMSVAAVCNVPFGNIYGNVVGVDAAGTIGYYVGRSTNAYWIVECNLTTGAVTYHPPITIAGEDLPYLIDVFTLNNGLIAFAHSEGVVITDKPQSAPQN